MAEITLRGNPIHTVGDLPAVGSPAPAFTLTGGDLADVTAGDFAGKSLVLNIFPSIDTGVCAASVRAFNEKAGGRDDAAVLNVSADLPFAQTRFCGAEGIENVTSASAFRSDFGVDLRRDDRRRPDGRAAVAGRGRRRPRRRRDATPSRSRRSARSPTTTPPSPPSAEIAVLSFEIGPIGPISKDRGLQTEEGVEADRQAVVLGDVLAGEDRRRA